jgi:hypothetical protein
LTRVLRDRQLKNQEVKVVSALFQRRGQPESR